MGLLQAKTLYSRDLALRRIWVRPPEPSADLLLSAAPEGLYLGRSRLLATPVYWDFHSLVNPHLALVGMTGSGKSYLIKAFITRAQRQWATPALILDWAGEYTPWVERAGGSVIRLGAGAGLNVLDCRPAKPRPDSKAHSSSRGPARPIRRRASAPSTPLSAPLSDGARSPHAYTPRFRIEQLIASLQILGSLEGHPRAARLLQEAMQAAFKHKRLPIDRPLSASLSAARLPTLRDALARLRARARRAQSDEELQLALSTLEFFCPPGVDYFSRPGGLRLDELVGSGVVSLDLSGLPHEAHRSLAGLTMLQLLKERMRASGWSPQARLRLLVVADEAWKIAQDERSDLVAILREGRKYAFGLIVASQNPADLSPTILSNAGTLISFRLGSHESREAIRQSLQLPPSQADELERLPVGQALIRLGWSQMDETALPFQVRIEGEEPARPYHIEVQDMDIEIERSALRQRLWRQGLSDAQIGAVCAAFERNDRTLAADELARLLASSGLGRPALLATLRALGVPDAQLGPIFSRLSARALGVSVRELVPIEVSDA